MAQNTIEMGRSKKIALVAHDNKKEELFEWAKCNCKLLAEHSLYATVYGLADVDAVIEELVEHALIKQVAVAVGGAGRDQFPRQQRRRFQLDEPFEDRPDPLGVGFMVDDLAVADLISERGTTTRPHARLPGGGDLVADPLANDLPFILGEGQHDVQMHAAHGVGRIERLRNGDERRLMTLEQFDQLVKIQQRTGEPVDLIDDHDVDAAGLNFGQETPKGRAI